LSQKYVHNTNIYVHTLSEQYLDAVTLRANLTKKGALSVILYRHEKVILSEFSK
jgi:hypothetical protein